MSNSNASAGAALAGWYVILCRPSGENTSLARSARALGAESLSLPVFRIVAAADPQRTRDALSDALRCKLLIFTSPAAVRAAARLHRDWQGCAGTALVVGKGTASALEDCGWRGNIVLPKQPNSEALLELAQLDGAARVGLVTAPEGRGLIEAGLNARGLHLVRADVYRRQAIALPVTRLDRLQRAQGRLALLASSEQAVTRLLDQLPDALRQRVLGGTAVVSSKRLRDSLAERGFAHILLAAGPDPAALLGALAGFAATSSSCSITRAAHARFD